MIHQAQQLRHWANTIEPDYPGIAETMRDGAKEIERLTTELDQATDKFGDGSHVTIGQEAFFDWNGRMRSGHVKEFVDAGTMYVSTTICYPTEQGARQAADYRPAQPKVKARKR